MTTTKVQNHINEKFEKFANHRNISLLEAPTMCDIVIFTSTTKGKTQHMAAPAEKDCVPGYLINLGDKRLQFFSASDVRCIPIKSGSVVKNKALLHIGPDGLAFSAR